MTRIRKIIIAFLLTISLIVVLPFASVDAADDYTALQAARDDVSAAMAASTDYHDESYTAFSLDLAALGGLAAADALLGDINADQAAVDDMAEALETLLEHLVTESVYNDVSDAYLTADAFDVTAFTQRSRTIYDAALGNVRAVILNPRSGDATMLAQLAVLAAAEDALVLLADKTDLLAAVAAAQLAYGTDGSAYIPSTFAAFQLAYDAFATAILAGVLRSVQEIVADADASVPEAAEALAGVDAALALLVLRPDKTALSAAYDEAAAFDLSPYTPATAPLFTAGLIPIKNVIDDPEALAAEVAIAEGALADLYDVLVLRADKSALILVNNAAIIAYYEERERYTTSSYAVFRDAVLAYGTYFEVNTLIADENASQAATDAMVATIDSALAELVLRGDVDLLVAAHATASALDLTPYTPASSALYRSALAAALVVIVDQDTDQAEADAALATLGTIESLLVLLADKTELLVAIEDGASVRATIYSNSSYQILVRGLEAADSLIDDLDASQAAVDEATEAIHEAIAGLTLKTAEIVIRESKDTVSITDYVTLGDAVVQSYAVSDPLILAIDPDGTLRGLKYGSATVTVTLSNGITETLTVVVKAKIQTITLVYAILIPVFASGGAIAMLLWNEKTLAFLKGVKLFRKKPQA
ncbi:MAG TPA: hypothetical protein DCR44_05370 [Acholeplasmatales bacterium]|nr:hypothetical protein [Acholeplasmatales bacterium]